MQWKGCDTPCMNRAAAGSTPEGEEGEGSLPHMSAADPRPKQQQGQTVQVQRSKHAACADVSRQSKNRRAEAGACTLAKRPQARSPQPPQGGLGFPLGAAPKGGSEGLHTHLDCHAARSRGWHFKTARSCPSNSRGAPRGAARSCEGQTGWRLRGGGAGAAAGVAGSSSSCTSWSAAAAAPLLCAALPTGSGQLDTQPGACCAHLHASPWCQLLVALLQAAAVGGGAAGGGVQWAAGRRRAGRSCGRTLSRSGRQSQKGAGGEWKGRTERAGGSRVQQPRTQLDSPGLRTALLDLHDNCLPMHQPSTEIVGLASAGPIAVVHALHSRHRYN